MDMRIFSLSMKGGYALLEIFVRDMNLENASDIRKETKIFLEDNNYPDIIVHLSGMEEIDSTGVGSLLVLYNTLRLKGKKMIIVCDAGRILKIFTISKLDEKIKVLPTLEEAVARI